MKKNTRIKPVVLIALTVFALLLGACSPAAVDVQTVGIPPAVEAESYPAEALSADVAGEVFAEVAEPAPDAASGGGPGVASSVPARSERLIVMNADLALLVEDPAAVMNYVNMLALEYGGFVVASNLGTTNGDYGGEVPFAAITIRVPAVRLQAALTEIEDLSLEVLNKNLTGKDVTADYTDLQSRLRNLERAEAQLTQVMEAAYDTTDVLAVYAELTQVTEQMEIIRGQIQYYEEAAAFSAISLTLKFKETPPPPQPPVNRFDPGVIARRALGDLKESMQYWYAHAIHFFLYSLPVFLVKVTPYAVILWLAYRTFGRRWLKKRTQQPATAD